MKSTNKSNIRSSREHLGAKERSEDETNDNLQAMDQQESTLDDDDDDDDDDECGGGEKGTASNLAAPKRKSFDERFKALVEFKDEFGHCDVRVTKSSEYYSLAQWCKNMRSVYKQVQKERNASYQTLSKLTDDNVRRLEESGFKLSLDRRLYRAFDALGGAGEVQAEVWQLRCSANEI